MVSSIDFFQYLIHYLEQLHSLREKQQPKKIHLKPLDVLESV